MLERGVRIRGEKREEIKFNVRRLVFTDSPTSYLETGHFYFLFRKEETLRHAHDIIICRLKVTSHVTLRESYMS